MPGFLDGITVLDFSTVGPAARCSRVLADYGADVIKVGAPPRAGAVQIEPVFYAYSGHRGMRRVRLDLKSDRGRSAFLRLAETADVVLESFRPGVVDKLGVGYDDVRAVKPDIVYCSTTGFGQTGPASQWAGHDINYLAVGGYLHCSEPAAHGGPPIPGATVADIAAGGMQAAMAIMGALVGRSKTQDGAYLDVSVADGALWMLSLYIDEYLVTGVEPGFGHNILTGRYACYGVYACADGQHMSVGAIEPQFYANLCRALGCEQWIDHQTDDAVQHQIRADFAEAFMAKTRDEWTELLASANTCAAPVYAAPDLVADAQFEARGAFVEARHPDHGTFRQVGPVFAGCERPAEVVEVPGPASQTADVLAEAGLTPDEIDQMIDEGTAA